jgi:hypothetical protein
MFIAIAVCLFIYGIYLLHDISSFTSKASSTTGQIVARDGTRFTIQYMVDGRAFQIEESLPSTKGASISEREKLQPGVAVPVLYERSSPGNARWGAARNWFFPELLILLSILFGLAGFLPDLGKGLFGNR